MIPTLPVFATTLGAYSKIFGNAAAVGRASLLPVLALLIIRTIQDSVAPGAPASFLFWCLQMPFAAMIAVACHRIVLLGPDSLINAWSFYWTSRESSMLVWIFILSVIIYGSTVILGTVFLMSPERPFGISTPWLGTLLTWISVTYVSGRFCMVLPATALNKRCVLSNSGYMTAGNGLQVAVALLLPLAIMWLLLSLAGFVVINTAGDAFRVFTYLVAVVTFVTELAVISLCYKFIRDSALNVSPA